MGGRTRACVAGVVASVSICAVTASGSLAHATHHSVKRSADALVTKTPIKHLVVLFQENVPFDHTC